MKLQFFCPVWGMEQESFEAFCAQAAEAGYIGIEMTLPHGNDAETKKICSTLKQNGLTLLAQHWETHTTDLSKHLSDFRKRLEWLAAQNPLFINSQTGKDWYSFEDNLRVIEIAEEVSAETGIKIVHETHRGRFTFCAAQTRRFLEAKPDLRLTADFSHWCNVSESLLEDQVDAVAATIQRTDHIHARVGHQEGPQITDPRAPEWTDALNAHLGWWDAIVSSRKEGITITPEFGPAPYMPTLPYTNLPVANQWEINEYMMNLLKQRYAEPA